MLQLFPYKLIMPPWTHPISSRTITIGCKFHISESVNSVIIKEPALMSPVDWGKFAVIVFVSLPPGLSLGLSTSCSKQQSFYRYERQKKTEHSRVLPCRWGLEAQAHDLTQSTRYGFIGWSTSRPWSTVLTCTALLMKHFLFCQEATLNKADIKETLNKEARFSGMRDAGSVYININMTILQIIRRDRQFPLLSSGALLHERLFQQGILLVLLI